MKWHYFNEFYPTVFKITVQLKYLLPYTTVSKIVFISKNYSKNSVKQCDVFQVHRSHKLEIFNLKI